MNYTRASASRILPSPSSCRRTLYPLRRASIVFTIIALIGTFTLFWNELDIMNRPGAHAATSYIFDQINEGDKILVSSPFIYFAIDHYAREEYDSRALPKLYDPDFAIIHFGGGPIFVDTDIATTKEVAAIKADTIWVIDTTGFGGSEMQLPDQWLRTDKQTFPEVFPHQGDIFVTKYENRRLN